MSESLEIELDDGTESTYSVGELCSAINGVLRRGFSDGVWVRGEIQGYRVAGQHAYFTLAESNNGDKATLNVSCFGGVRTKIAPLLKEHGIELADGLKVRIHGSLDYYAPFGKLSLKMTNIDPRFTIGDLALEREAVVRRLKESGLYDLNRTRSLSVVPMRIGLVTSLDSAAYHDFTKHLRESHLGFQVLAADTRVQGDAAAAQIVRRIALLGARPDLDVVVVIRGGGSRNDLAVFDNEAVATAIANCPLPVFTGIGHEIDTAVADEVAFRSHKTPTACAASLIDEVLEFVEATESAWATIEATARQVVAGAQHELDSLATDIRHRVVTAVELSGSRLVQHGARLSAAHHRVVERAEARIAVAAAGLARVPARLDPEVRHLDAVAERVRLLDPVHTMARGWSITRTADGRTVRDIADVQVGHELITTFANGTARSRVEEINP